MQEATRLIKKPLNRILEAPCTSCLPLAMATSGEMAIIIPKPKTMGIANTFITSEDAASCL